MTEDMIQINNFIDYRLQNNYISTKKHCNKELKCLKLKYRYTEDMIDEYISSNLNNEQLINKKFINGQMDLYLFDKNYRIVIENIILSGLNGKHNEFSKDINQLVTYDKYINHLNLYEKKVKQNKVIIYDLIV